jgi:dTMP kinase
MINSYLLNKSEMDDHSIHLLFSANRWEASNGLVKHLTEGTSVVCDRYAYSGVAFSAAKVTCNTARREYDPTLRCESSSLQEEEEPLLNFDWCQSSDVGLPAPDAIIFLDLTQEEAEKRGG